MDGRAVRAAGGIRQKYQPIACSLTGSWKPVDVASALLRLSGAAELYIADLDAITRTHSVSPAVRAILDNLHVPTWLDAGIGRLRACDLPLHANLCPVVGFETCREPRVLAETLQEVGDRPVAFSIDLMHGRLVGDWHAWGVEGDRDAPSLARRVVDMGVRTLIVIDLARVGSGDGTGTEPLVKVIRREFPEVELIAGGGVKSCAELDRLGQAGANAVLVARAIYDGTLLFQPGDASNPVERMSL
jgi:phosphoribosylformimino-5-aminoimidazole carboxamide ribotide isomerase